MALTDLVVAGLVAVGAFFAFVAVVGIVRLPDVYARIHAVSKTETLGAIFALAGVALVLDSQVGTIKSVFLLAFLFLTNPTAAHAIARAADDQGIEPWTRGEAEAAASDADTDGPAAEGPGTADAGGEPT